VPEKCPGLVLLVSSSLRQSRELFAKVIGFRKELEPPLAEKFRSNAVDPVTAFERVRAALRAPRRSAGGSFAVPVYDGARRFDILGHILPKKDAGEGTLSMTVPVFFMPLVVQFVHFCASPEACPG
jgi:hypothetical protein